MNLPERYPADDPREWMNHARSDLALAKNRIPDTHLEHFCFHAQQAAEKAIKAVMIKRGIEFPYTHDLARLLTLLDESGESIPHAVRYAEELTHYAASTRYPTFDGTVSEKDYQEAVEAAEAVVQWAEERI